MEKYVPTELKDDSVKDILGESKSKVYTHAVFAQCILPAKSLPNNQKYYEVRHGKSSLVIQAGLLRDESGRIHEMEVPSGAKARLLFPYIIDNAKRTGNPTVDMGHNLYQFMLQNHVPIGGKNRSELLRQANNISTSMINLGVWGETDNHKYMSQKHYRVAEEMSFWAEKNPDQFSMWNQYITLSNEFMAAIEEHSILLDLQPFIKLQSNPKAMDMYTWLSYRLPSVKGTVKISYKDLHSIFGQQTKAHGSFKQEFKKALELALPYVPIADLDMESDKKHLILRNNKHKIFLPAGTSTQITQDIPIEEGVFGEMQRIGLSNQKIKELTSSNAKEKIEKALLVTKQGLEKGKIKNAPGFLIRALKDGWEPALSPQENKHNIPESLELDTDYENFIKDQDWKEVRKKLVGKYGVAHFNNWIKDLQVDEKGREEVVLSAKTRFIAEEVKKTYLADLEKFWMEADKKIKTVKITIMKKK